ncbi:MAG: PH domain-containing protein [Proteobacteria bacterium]|nr:PH domain-containing protein [Pseudomonadota bacterium]
MRKLWKWFRWGAFLFALAVDGALFYTSDPFSTRSFVATGLASLIMFLVFVKLSTLIRNGARIRNMLERGEHKVHETGLHWIRLWQNIRADRLARRFIFIPLRIALVVTLFEIAWGLWWVGARSGLESAPWFHAVGALFHLLPDNSALIGGYIPLIFAIPFAIAHIAEWNTHRYVITPTRIIIMSGIFDYEVHTITLSRVVDAKQHYTFWEQLLNYGDVVLRETAGNDEVIQCVWGPKKFAKVAMHFSHGRDANREEDESD